MDRGDQFRQNVGISSQANAAGASATAQMTLGAASRAVGPSRTTPIARPPLHLRRAVSRQLQDNIQVGPSYLSLLGVERKRVSNRQARPSDVLYRTHVEHPKVKRAHATGLGTLRQTLRNLRCDVGVASQPSKRCDMRLGTARLGAAVAGVSGGQDTGGPALDSPVLNSLQEQERGRALGRWVLGYTFESALMCPLGGRGV